MSVTPAAMVQSFEQFLPAMDSPPKLLYGAAMVLLITYSSALPTMYRSFADSLIGRVLGIAAILASLELLGWIYGLLTAVAFLLVLHHAPRFHHEGFEGGGSISQMDVIGKRWFVETVLGERPSKISTHEVITRAIKN
jgi:hypothetical protein